MRCGSAALALTVVFVAGEGCGGIEAEEAVFLEVALGFVEDGEAEVLLWDWRVEEGGLLWGWGERWCEGRSGIRS